MQGEQKEISGFINIDKPEDWTSHDVVAKLRKLLGIRKIGHAGTLDPFATGVLPVAIGSATRLIRFLRKSKRYLAEMDLSHTMDTDDFTGEKLRVRDGVMAEAELRSKLEQICGEQKQIPPLYSAKKINGRKLYELMRAGESIDLSELKPKQITIKEISLLDFDYPKATIEVACSEGTYIRAIARDLGGHLTALRRLESNGFDIKSAIRFEDLQDGDLCIEDLIINPRAYLDLPSVNFDRKDTIALQQGRQIYLDDPALISDIKSTKSHDQLVQIYHQKDLVGLANILVTGGRDTKLQPKIIL